MRIVTALCLVIIALTAGFFIYGQTSSAMENGADLMKEAPQGEYPTVTLAGGCFWCLESEFRSKDGVLFTRVGYSGGTLENPTYKDVTTGETGHAEAVEITYDPEKTSYDELVTYFLTRAHDATQLNRQGVDVGPQYRSTIFYVSDEEKAEAQKLIDQANASGRYKRPIVTTLEPLGQFWLAEDYHQQYYEKYEAENGTPHIRVMLKKQKKMLENQ